MLDSGYNDKIFLIFLYDRKSFDRVMFLKVFSFIYVKGVVIYFRYILGNIVFVKDIGGNKDMFIFKLFGILIVIIEVWLIG